MAILFCDSQNSLGSTSDLTKLWGTNTDNTKNTLNLTGGPSSDPCIQMATSNTAILQAALYSAGTSTTMGGRLKFKQAALSAITTYHFLTLNGRTSTGAVVEWHLSLNSSGQVSTTFFGSTGVLATGSTNIADSAWHVIEFQILPSDTVGTTKVWVDGVLEINFGPGDNNGTTTPHATPWAVNSPYVELGAVNSGATAVRSFKDIIIFDSAGVSGNLRTGDQPFGNIVIATLRPSGAGTTTQFTPSAGSNFQCVDEVAQDGNTTYVEDTVSGHRDLYAMGNLGLSPTTVYGVVAKIFATNPGSLSISMKQTLKSGATTTANTATVTNLIGDYKEQVYDNDPDTNNPWTGTTVDAVEQGFEVA